MSCVPTIPVALLLTDSSRSSLLDMSPPNHPLLFHGYQNPAWRRRNRNQGSSAPTEEKAREHNGHHRCRWNQEPSRPGRGWATAGVNRLHTHPNSSTAPSRKGALREQSLKMQFPPGVLFSPLLWLSSLRRHGDGPRAAEPVFTGGENASSGLPWPQKQGGTRRIHSHEDQLSSLWTLGGGGPSPELVLLCPMQGR